MNITLRKIETHTENIAWNNILRKNFSYINVWIYSYMSLIFSRKFRLIVTYWCLEFFHIYISLNELRKYLILCRFKCNQNETRNLYDILLKAHHFENQTTITYVVGLSQMFCFHSTQNIILHNSTSKDIKLSAVIYNSYFRVMSWNY